MANAAVQFYLNAKDGVSSVLRTVRTGFTNLRDNVKETHGFINSTFGRLSLGIGAGAVGGYLSSVNQEIQDFRAQLRVLLGDADKANIALEGLAEFELKTPFEYRESIEAFILLRKMGISPTMEALTELGNVAAQQGKSINYVAEAIKSASIGMANPLEAATGAIIQYTANGTKLKVTYQGVAKEIDRNVGAIGDWVREIGRMPEVAGAAEARMQTLGGAMSNMRGAVYRLAVAVGDAGFSKDLSTLANRIGGVANALRTNGSQINWWYRLISTSIKAIVTNLTSGVKMVWNFGLMLGFIFKRVFHDVVKQFYSLLDTIAAGMNTNITWFNRIFNTNFELFRRHTTDIERHQKAMDNAEENIRGAGAGMVAALEPAAEASRAFWETLVEGPKEASGGLDYTVDKFNEIATVTRTAAQLEQERAEAYRKTLAAVMALRKWELENQRQVTTPEQRAMLMRELARRESAFNNAPNAEAKAAASGPMDELRKLMFGEGTRELQFKGIDRMIDAALLQVNNRIEDERKGYEAGLIARAIALTPEDLEYIRKNLELVPGITDNVFANMVRQGRLAARELANEFDQTFEEISRDIVGGFVDGAVNGFQLLVMGSKQAGLAFRQAFFGAIADVAAQESKFYLGKALAATGEGLLLAATGQPGAGSAFAAAGKYLAAAAAFGAIGGGAGKAAGGLVGGSSGPASDFARDAQTLSRGELGTATIVLQGDPVYDFTNPRRLDEFARMLETIGGRRIVIRNTRG